jgi:hypothetical protein
VPNPRNCPVYLPNPKANSCSNRLHPAILTFAY